jgi:hypothetical protein
MQIAVIGSAVEDDPGSLSVAQALGTSLARMGHVVVCGGRGGIMEAVSQGVHEAEGTVIGILPTNKRHTGNRFLTAEVITGLQEMRNAVVVASGDLVIAFPGAFGTLSELAFAMKYDRPIIVVQPERFFLDFTLIPYERLTFAWNLQDIINTIEEYDDL